MCTNVLKEVTFFEGFTDFLASCVSSGTQAGALRNRRQSDLAQGVSHHSKGAPLGEVGYLNPGWTVGVCVETSTRFKGLGLMERNSGSDQMICNLVKHDNRLGNMSK